MLKLDLHVHTHHSPDSSTDPERAIQRAHQRGLDGISFTDHDYFSLDENRRLRQNSNLLLIPGMEVSSSVGHILAYFISEPVEPWREPEEIIQDIHQQGGLAYVAHPYRLVKHYPANYFDRFDGIEVFNGRSGDPERTGTPNYHARYLVEEADVPVTGGSDSHLSWTIGNGYTQVDADRSLDAVEEALRKGRTSAHGTPSLQTNRALSQFIRLFKEPSVEQAWKIWPKCLRWLGRDLWRGLIRFRDWIV